MTDTAIVEPLNTKAWVLDQKALRAATEAVADSEGWNAEDWPITEQTAKAAVLAYLSASPALPAVDGGEIEAAERNRDAARANFLTMQGAADKLRVRTEEAESRVQSLEVEVKVLREALKPFGEYLDEVKFDLDNHGKPLPDETGPGWTYLTAGDFRRARAALKENGNG